MAYIRHSAPSCFQVIAFGGGVQEGHRSSIMAREEDEEVGGHTPHWRLWESSPTTDFDVVINGRWMVETWIRYSILGTKSSDKWRRTVAVAVDDLGRKRCSVPYEDGSAHADIDVLGR